MLGHARIFVLVLALILPCIGQTASDELPQALYAMLNETVRYQSPDPAVMRTVALVVSSLKRLESLGPAERDTADPFRAELLSQIRKARTVLSLGSNSLGAVQRDLAANLQRLYGTKGLEAPFARLMGAVATLEGRAGRNIEMENLVAAVIKAALQHEGSDRESALTTLLVESAVVIEIHGAHPVPLRSIIGDLSSL